MSIIKGNAAFFLYSDTLEVILGGSSGFPRPHENASSSFSSSFPSYLNHLNWLLSMPSAVELLNHVFDWVHPAMDEAQPLESEISLLPSISLPIKSRASFWLNSFVTCSQSVYLSSAVAFHQSWTGYLDTRYLNFFTLGRDWPGESTFIWLRTVASDVWEVMATHWSYFTFSCETQQNHIVCIKQRCNLEFPKPDDRLFTTMPWRFNTWSLQKQYWWQDSEE